MEKNRIPLDTLLRRLGDSNYDTLILQERLRMEGYSFHYIIDVDLIGNYCFPKGIIESNKNRIKKNNISDEYLADEQVTLHALFYLNKNAQRVIILDEYYQELQGFIRFARIHSKPNSKFSEGLFDDKTLNELEKLNDNEGLANLIRVHFSKLLAEVTLKIEGLKKLSSLFADDTLIFDSQSLENDLLIEAFEDSKKNVQYKNEIFSFFNTKDIEYTNETSKKVDAQIISRVLSINKFLSSTNKSKGFEQNARHIFFYLGDSNTNEVVFKKIENKAYYPSIKGTKINLYKTINELFAHLICIEYDTIGRIDSIKTIENLTLLKKYGKAIKKTLKETQNKISSTRDNEIDEYFPTTDEFKYFFSRYFNLRNSFENAGLFQSFKFLYDSIKEDIKGTKFTQIKNILEKLNEKHKEIELELKPYEDRIKALDEENKVNNLIALGFEEIRLGGSEFTLQKGQDLIEGSYQFLPIIFRIQNISEFSTIYAKPINMLTELIVKKKINESKKVCDSLLDLFKLLERNINKYNDPIEEKIIKTLVFLILPNSNEKSSTELIINWLSKSDNESLPLELRVELWYTLCWIYRRTKNYSASIRIADEGIKTVPNDPRFYHGKSLANYCMWVENKKSVNIDDIISGLKKSKKLYYEFIEDNYTNGLKASLHSKIIDTFNNNLCYFYTEKSFLIKDSHPDMAMELINIARHKYLKELKKADGTYIETLPEYYDTESNLEFVESYMLDDKINRLSHSKIAIEQAIKLSNHLELKGKYLKRLYDIEERIDILQVVSSKSVSDK